MDRRLKRGAAHVRAAVVRALGPARLRLVRRPLGVGGGPLLRRLDAELLLLAASHHSSAGRLSEAIAACDQAGALAPTNRRVRYRQRLARDEADVLTGAWRPPRQSEHPAPRSGGATPGRPLHVVGQSLPNVQVGYTIRTQAIVKAQRSVGLDPRVVTDVGFPSQRPDVGSEYVDGIPHHRLPMESRMPASLRDRLDMRYHLGARVVEAVRPSVLHAASDFMNAEVALAWGEHFGLPVVYEVRGFWADTWLSQQADPAAAGSERYRGRWARELACMQRAHAVVTLGEAMKAELVSRGVDERKIVVVPNGVDPDHFVPVARSAALADRYGIGPDELTLGYVSSMNSYEGVRVLVEAGAALSRQGRPVHVVLVGDGPDRRPLEDLSRRLGVRDRVHFAGQVHRDVVLDYYGLIDVFVVPRLAVRVAELVTPIKPYEAMATERTLVVSDVAALRELVDEGETGLLFRAGSVADLVAVVDRLVDDPDQRRRLGQNARQWVRANRTWDQNGQRYLDLYRRLGAV